MVKVVIILIALGFLMEDGYAQWPETEIGTRQTELSLFQT